MRQVTGEADTVTDLQRVDLGVEPVELWAAAHDLQRVTSGVSAMAAISRLTRFWATRRPT